MVVKPHRSRKLTPQEAPPARELLLEGFLGRHDAPLPQSAGLRCPGVKVSLELTSLYPCWVDSFRWDSPQPRCYIALSLHSLFLLCFFQVS